jgi:hypothetical protein
LLKKENMKKLSFKDFKVKNIHNITGGAIETEGGRHSSGFCYDSDFSTWTPGATRWTIRYFGILVDQDTCPCTC